MTARTAIVRASRLPSSDASASAENCVVRLGDSYACQRASAGQGAITRIVVTS